jgi:hypothetical protein
MRRKLKRLRIEEQEVVRVDLEEEIAAQKAT